MKRALFVLMLAGCAAPKAAPVAEAPRKEESAPVVIQAQDPEWQKLAEELTKGMTVAEQQKALEGQRHYDLALAWYNKADFEKAKVEAQLAIQKHPEHIAARKLLADVNEIILGRPGGFPTPAEHDLRVAQVKVEQQQLEITNHILHGERFLNASMYQSALREFENAEFKIRNMPYDVKSHNDLLPKVKELAARAKTRIRD